MGAFSPDGQWWWDGAKWVATREIELTLPETEFERSGRLKSARKLLIVSEWIEIAGLVGVGSIVGIPLVPFFLVAYYVAQYRAFKGYRDWTLELLTLATSQLLGPEEPMLAGETTLWVPVSVLYPVKRDFAVAATKAHILMFWFSHYDSPVCRVLFVARPDEVEMKVRRGLTGRKMLVIRYSGAWWVLLGFWGVLKPEQVLQAWSDGLATGKSQPANPPYPRPTSC